VLQEWTDRARSAQQEFQRQTEGLRADNMEHDRSGKPASSL
jgi:hypothetical protein